MVKKAAQATPNRLLKAARKERGWTQQEVADRIGAPLALNVSRWESGTTFPSAYYIERLCQLYGKSPRELGLSQLEGETGETIPSPLVSGGLRESVPLLGVWREETTLSNAALSASAPSVQGHYGASFLTVRDDSLPLPLTPLIGREQEATAACLLLGRPEVRLVTLTGTGGVGKTRLALRVASELRGNFTDGIWFVSLASLSDPALVVPTIAQALGMKETEQQSLHELLRFTLHEKQLLLLLDNFERLISAAPQLVELLASCSGLKLLVTSRAVLHVQGEYEFPVSPLALPACEPLPASEALAQSPAVALFLQRAQAVRPDFRLTSGNVAALAEICVRLDGLPLALELGAARMKLFSTQELLAQLDHPLAVLIGGAQDLPVRQQTLRNTIQWSYQLLNMQEQCLFRRLSVFAGGWTVENARAVCTAGAERGRDSLIGDITSLLDKSLLQIIHQEGKESRLYLLETIREYAAECLEASGEQAMTHLAHAHYYLRLAEEAESNLRGPQQAEWVERLNREYANLRAALQWCLDHQEPLLALRLATALAEFWLLHGPVSEGHVFLEHALAQGEGAPTRLLARATGALGWLVCAKGDFDQAERWCEQSLSLFSHLGEPREIALTLYRLGYIRLFKGESARAQQQLEEALSQFRAIADRLGTADTLHTLGNAALAQGKYTQARHQLEESLALYRETNAPSGIADALYLLGSTTFQQGELLQAQTYFEESLVLCKHIGHKRGAALTRLAQGLVALVQEEYAQAQSLLEEGLSLTRAGGWKEQIAWGAYGLGWVACAQSDYPTARARFEEAISLCREVGNQIFTAYYLDGLATVGLALGHVTWAAQVWGAAERVRTTGNIAVPPILRRVNEQLQVSLQAHLGEETFRAMQAQGQRMTLDEVLDLGKPSPLSTAGREQSHQHNKA